MEQLRDLQQIYNSASGRFNQYIGEDFVLPQIFKDQVKEINSNIITYNTYSAVIETRGNQNGVLNIYMPNQWFYIASYFTDFYNELLKYKSYALKVISKERLKELNGLTLTEAELNAVKQLDIDEQSQKYLIKFITDYSWWSGAKTIDRGDFYVSPILNSARLVNASQSFVADLCAFLADKKDLVNAIISGEDSLTATSKDELLRQASAAKFLRKALKIVIGEDANLSRLAALNKYIATNKQLKINGFNLWRKKDDLPLRLEDVWQDIEIEYNGLQYVMYLEWTPADMERLFFPVFNSAYNGKFSMGKEGNEYVLYKINQSRKDGKVEGPLQQIFYGAPGTGKSYKVKELTGKDNVVRTTFHPDSDYSTFVGCYKPTTVDEPLMTVIGTKAVPVENSDGTLRTESKIVYEFVEQAFLKAYIKAWKMYAEDENNPQKQYLVIEEINRGNCAQIFGDLFQLLDRGTNGFSEYPIEADKDMQKHLAKAFKDMAYLESPAIGEMSSEETARAIRNGEKLILPSNLYIWATMNTSDQSLFPIDSAFKRRWDWQYVPIHDGGKGWQIKADGKRYDWWQFVDAMNNKIGTATYSEDKKLGYFFCKAKDGVIDAETFVGKVVFYIWNDVFKDFAEEAGNLFKDVDGSMLSFNKFYTIGANGQRIVVEPKIAILMQNLGVEPITTSNSGNEEVVGDVEDEMQNDIFANQRKETLISISIPNHPIIKSSDSNQFDAFIKALRIIGFERIKGVAQSLKYKRLGNIPVISTQRNEIIDNNNQGYSYYQEGGLFIIKGCKYYTYIRILEDLNSMLNIGLSMETK